MPSGLWAATSSVCGTVAADCQIIQAVLHSKAAIRQLPSPLAEQALEAYAGSIKTVWAVSGVVGIITVICAFGIQEKNTEGKVGDE